MQVLRALVTRESINKDEDEALDDQSSDYAMDIQHRLLCIVSAFELLSGQGSFYYSSSVIDPPDLLLCARRRSSEHRSH